MLNRYAEHRESKLGSVPNSSHPLKEVGLLGALLVMEVSQEVPQLAWQLTKSFWLGRCVYNAEDLARGAA